MLTRDLTPCFVQDFGLGSRTGYEKALLVGLFDRTFTCLDHRTLRAMRPRGRPAGRWRSSCAETGGCRRSTRGGL